MTGVNMGAREGHRLLFMVLEFPDHCCWDVCVS